MKRIILIMCCFLSVFAWADDGRTTISLNGEWDFDQTEQAFPHGNIPVRYRFRDWCI
ncbi:hypothetical protein M5E82_21420 [Parabacteroides distasonis]|nr:hypothetical protein M5E82_21420 [Parabacteroides distasonis]